MSMIRCHGCNKEIHSTALACPGCGAPQIAKSAPNEAVAQLRTAAASAPQPKGWKKWNSFGTYFSFKGRSRRKDYWLFVLFGNLFLIALNLFDMNYGTGKGTVSLVPTLLFTVATIAIGVRRLHDSDRSGWWVLLPIVNLVFLCFKGTQGDNRFGPDPKSAA